MSNRRFFVIVAAVVLPLGALVYMHRPRAGQAARLPQTLHRMP